MPPAILEERKPCPSCGHYEDRPVASHSRYTHSSTIETLVYLCEDPDSLGIYHVFPGPPISVTSDSNGKRSKKRKRKLEAEGWKRYSEQENHATEQDTGTTAEEAKRRVRGEEGVERKHGERAENNEEVEDGEDREEAEDAEGPEGPEGGEQTLGVQGEDCDRPKKRPRITSPSSSPPLEIGRTQPSSATPSCELVEVRLSVHSRLKGDKRTRGLKDFEISDLVEKVFAFGSTDAFKQIHRLVKQLRQGRLTSLLTRPSSADIESTRQTLARRDEDHIPSSEVAAFYLAYLGVTRMKSKNLLDMIAHRKALAKLSTCYECLKSQLRPNAKGFKQRVGEQKLWLFHLLYASHVGVHRPAEHHTADDSGQCRLDWHEFTDDLRYGSRWQRIRDTFGGEGVFALMPPSIISNRFVERLQNDHFDSWLSLVQEFMAPDCELVRKASILMDHVLSGNSLPKAKLRLEMVEEVEIGTCNDFSTLLDGWDRDFSNGNDLSC